MWAWELGLHICIHGLSTKCHMWGTGAVPRPQGFDGATLLARTLLDEGCWTNTLDCEHGTGAHAQRSQERAIWVLHGGRRRSAPGWTQVTLWPRGTSVDTCNSGKPIQQAKARLPWTVFGHTTLNMPDLVRLPWTDRIPGPRTPSNPRQGCLLALGPPVSDPWWPPWSYPHSPQRAGTRPWLRPSWEQQAPLALVRP